MVEHLESKRGPSSPSFPSGVGGWGGSAAWREVMMLSAFPLSSHHARMHTHTPPPAVWKGHWATRSLMESPPSSGGRTSSNLGFGGAVSQSCQWLETGGKRSAEADAHAVSQDPPGNQISEEIGSIRQLSSATSCLKADSAAGSRALLTQTLQPTSTTWDK